MQDDISPQANLVRSEESPANSTVPLEPFRWPKPSDGFTSLPVAPFDESNSSSGHKWLVAPTDHECASAQISADRLRLISRKIETELRKVKSRRENERGYYKEYEDLKAEALHGVVWDLLSVAQFDKVFKRMSQMPDYEKLAPKLSAAYHSLHAAYELQDGISAETDQQRVHKVLGATISARDALLEIPVEELDPNDPARKYIENSKRFYELFEIVLEFYLQHRDRKVSWSEFAGSFAKSSIDVAALWAPPVKLGVQLEGLGERGGKWYLARLAINNLDSVLAKEWRAELYLQQRLDGFNSFLVEEERTLQMCSQR